jgi:hypothetical protein
MLVLCTRWHIDDLLGRYGLKEKRLREIRVTGLPLEIIKHMRKVDVRTIETSSLDYDPYDDPEADEMVDVTPKNDSD